MSKLTKISGIIGAIILIILDAWVIFNSFSLSGIEILNTFIIKNMIPCGLLLGWLTLDTIRNNTRKKSLCIVTMVLFVITAIIRALTLVLYILERIYANYLSSMTTTDYLDLIQFAAYGILAVAAVFLMIYLLKGKFEKTSLALCGTAALSLCVIWIINIYTLITEAIDISSGVFEAAVTFFKDGLAQDIIFILGYLFVFWVLTRIIKSKEKA